MPRRRGQRPAGPAARHRVRNACQCPARQGHQRASFPRPTAGASAGTVTSPVISAPRQTAIGQHSTKGRAHHGRCASARYERQCFQRPAESVLEKTGLGAGLSAPGSGDMCALSCRIKGCADWLGDSPLRTTPEQVEQPGLQGSRIRYVATGASEVASGWQHPRQGLGECPEGGHDFGVECFIRTYGPGQIPAMHRQLHQPHVEQHGRRNVPHPRMGHGALQRARGAERVAHRPVGAAERSDPVIRADVALLFLSYNLTSRAMEQQGVPGVLISTVDPGQEIYESTTVRGRGRALPSEGRRQRHLKPQQVQPARNAGFV
jgi:hypothetical protein